MMVLNIQEELEPGEHMLWQGQPHALRLLQPIDIFIMPVSLFWSGIPLSILFDYLTCQFPWLPLLSFLTKTNCIPKPTGGLLFFCTPFVLGALYLTLGRFVLNYWMRKRTFYYVTNQRLITTVSGWSQKIMSTDLGQMLSIEKIICSDGSGTLIWGDAQMRKMVTFQSSMIPTTAYADKAFIDITDAQTCYTTIQNAINSLK